MLIVNYILFFFGKISRNQSSHISYILKLMNHLLFCYCFERPISYQTFTIFSYAKNNIFEQKLPSFSRLCGMLHMIVLRLPTSDGATSGTRSVSFLSVSCF